MSAAADPTERRVRRFQIWLARQVRSGRIIAAIVAVAMGVLLYALLFSQDYQVGNVTVLRAEIGDPIEIVDTSETLDTSIFRLDAADAAARVAQLPYVASANVRTEFPDTVVISVTEREPALVWQVGQRPFLIDAQGNVLAEQSRPQLLTVAVEGDAPRLGSSLPAEEVAATLAVAEAMVPSGATLAWTARDGLVVRLTDDRVVIYGAAERIPLKLAVWNEVSRLNLEWTTLDLREPERPYYQ